MNTVKRSDTFPSAHDDAKAAELCPVSPQTLSNAYRLAYTDYDFMMRDELRPVRLQLELLGWRLMQRLSPVALLDTWREALIEWARGAGVLRELNEPRFPPLGPVRGLRVSLGEAFLAQVSSLVRSGAIRLPAAAPARGIVP